MRSSQTEDFAKFLIPGLSPESWLLMQLTADLAHASVTRVKFIREGVQASDSRGGNRHAPSGVSIKAWNFDTGHSC